MLRVFNSFQLVCAFSSGPLLIQWLSEAEFRGSGVAFWVSVVAYTVGFIGMIHAVHEDIS